MSTVGSGSDASDGDIVGIDAIIAAAVTGAADGYACFHSLPGWTGTCAIDRRIHGVKTIYANTTTGLAV